LLYFFNNNQTNIMKLKKLGIICGIAAFTVSMNHAQTVIYFDDFSGSSSNNLDGTAPDISPGAQLWTGGLNRFLADGSYNSISSVSPVNIRLPFAPVSGTIYTISVGLNMDVGANSWFGMALSNATSGAGIFPSTATNLPNPTNSSDAHIYQVNSNTTIIDGGGNVFKNRTTVATSHLIGSGNININEDASSQNLIMVLDTTQSAWAMSYFREQNGQKTQIGTTDTWTTNPTIDKVNLIISGGISGSLDHFSITVPEPSTALLGGLGVLALLRRRR
jgi:PEP-CTERM motif